MLVKTPIELSKISFKKNDVLLGLWCLKDSRNILHDQCNYEIVHYHWDNRDKFSYDYKYLEIPYERLLLNLAKDLDDVHGVKQGLMYWRIIIGPWLWSFIDVIFDRYECVKKAKASYPKIDAKLFLYELDSWCPLNFSEFWDQIKSDDWNEVVFSECIKAQDYKYQVYGEYLKNSRNEDSKKKNPRNILTYLNNLYSKLLRNTQTGTLFIHAYIPILKLIKLQLKLKQIPFLKLPTINIPQSRTSSLLRDSLCDEFMCSDNFEIFLIRLVRKLMPRKYLEDYLETKSKIRNTFPSNPHSIYTAVGYHGDDNFKVWVAEKVSLNVPLIIGQHGGSFGVALINQSEQHQLKVANKFLSWGWKSDFTNNIVRFPSLQLSGAPPIKGNPNGKILHVLSSMPRYFYQHFSMPLAGQFINYLKNQIKFLNELDIYASKRISIRPDNSGKKTGWNIERVLDVAGHSFRIDKSNDNLRRSLNKSCLCICTHNATVFLECLSINYPTVIFWQPSHHEIRHDAVPFFKLLEDVGILFYTPEDAARHVNNIIYNINFWWFSEKVQSARRTFCERYALASNNWLNEWFVFINKN